MGTKKRGSIGKRGKSQRKRAAAAHIRGRMASRVSRKQFIAGVGGAAISAGLLQMAGSAKAQTTGMTEAELLAYKHNLMTLAAFTDTIIPTYWQEDFMIYSPQGPLDTLPSVGANETKTKGGIDFPSSYNYLYALLPQASHLDSFVDELVGQLDFFSGLLFQDEFKDLNYYSREFLIGLLDKPDVLAQPPYGIPLAQALQLKQLITLPMYLCYFICYSELVNVFPQADGTYRRKKDNSWDIVPGAMWDQMGYPGPLYKEPSYVSEYDGLRVTIADGKVKFDKESSTVSFKRARQASMAARR